MAQAKGNFAHVVEIISGDLGTARIALPIT